MFKDVAKCVVCCNRDWRSDTHMGNKTGCLIQVKHLPTSVVC